jgi:hypothetical protein
MPSLYYLYSEPYNFLIQTRKLTQNSLINNTKAKMAISPHNARFDIDPQRNGTAQKKVRQDFFEVMFYIDCVLWRY